MGCLATSLLFLPIWKFLLLFWESSSWLLLGRSGLLAWERLSFGVSKTPVQILRLEGLAYYSLWTFAHSYGQDWPHPRGLCEDWRQCMFITWHTVMLRSRATAEKMGERFAGHSVPLSWETPSLSIWGWARGEGLGTVQGAVGLTDPWRECEWAQYDQIHGNLA